MDKVVEYCSYMGSSVIVTSMQFVELQMKQLTTRNPHIFAVHGVL